MRFAYCRRVGVDVCNCFFNDGIAPTAQSSIVVEQIFERSAENFTEFTSTGQEFCAREQTICDLGTRSVSSRGIRDGGI